MYSSLLTDLRVTPARQAGTRFTHLGQMEVLSWPRWLVTYRDGLPVCRQSPVQVVTGPGIEWLCCRDQRANHALARVVLQQRSRARSTPLMQQLHWLPIEWRITFKLATLTYKALHTGRPPSLADLIQLHTTPKVYAFVFLSATFRSTS